jgi:hypothetical protein
MLEIDGTVVCPQSLVHSFTANDLTRMLQQQAEHAQRLFLQRISVIPRRRKLGLTCANQIYLVSFLGELR